LLNSGVHWSHFPPGRDSSPAMELRSGRLRIRRRGAMTPRSIFASTSLFAVVLFSAAAAHAARDSVQILSHIEVPAGSSIRDAVCLLCSVDARGPIDRDVVVLFGNVHIATRAGHDVVVLFGNVTADNNATIAHDVVTLFGGLRLGQNATVGNDVVTMFGTIHAAETASISGNRVSQSAAILWIPLVVIGGIVWLIMSQTRHRRILQTGFPYPPPPPPPPSGPMARP
jgi:hypothetical protein